LQVTTFVLFEGIKAWGGGGAGEGKKKGGGGGDGKGETKFSLYCTKRED